MKKTYIEPSIKIHKMAAKRRLLASSDPENVDIHNRNTDKQW